jgi:hypothetical protein
MRLQLRAFAPLEICQVPCPNRCFIVVDYRSPVDTHDCRPRDFERLQVRIRQNTLLALIAAHVLAQLLLVSGADLRRTDRDPEIRPSPPTRAVSSKVVCVLLVGRSVSGTIEHALE